MCKPPLLSGSAWYHFVRASMTKVRITTNKLTPQSCRLFYYQLQAAKFSYIFMGGVWKAHHFDLLNFLFFLYNFSPNKSHGWLEQVLPLQSCRRNRLDHVQVTSEEREGRGAQWSNLGSQVVITSWKVYSIYMLYLKNLMIGGVYWCLHITHCHNISCTNLNVTIYSVRQTFPI